MKGKRALVAGGSNGIGLALSLQLLKRGYEKVYILDRSEPDCTLNDSLEYIRFNLSFDDYSILDNYADIDTLIITAGFGRVAPFEDIVDAEIESSFKVNALGTVKIIKRFYPSLSSNKNFYCAVMGSIAGLVSSPLFSVYGATKASICKFIESINIELEMKGSPNRILNVSPGSIQGTRFNGDQNNLDLTRELADSILNNMFEKNIIYIPDYENIYKGVLERYNANAHQFGINSYKYKMENGRVKERSGMKIGYLSGTFDLFHIGHLNLLRRARQYCDYLVVGVHKDASHKNKETYIPYEERVEIVRSIKYVDEVMQSLPEDDAVYNIIKYNYLFVGSDYKGSERFNRYEKYFEDKDVKIMYFPYTEGTSSTKLRIVIDKSCEE